MATSSGAVHAHEVIAPVRGEDQSLCQPHLERTGEKRPAYRMGMCRDCWAGRPLRTTSPPPDADERKTSKRLSVYQRQRMSEGQRRRWARLRALRAAGLVQ